MTDFQIAALIATLAVIGMHLLFRVLNLGHTGLHLIVRYTTGVGVLIACSALFLPWTAVLQLVTLAFVIGLATVLMRLALYAREAESQIERHQRQRNAEARQRIADAQRRVDHDA